MLDSVNHGFEDVYIPAISDPQTDHVTRFRQQAASQRHTHIPCYNSKDYRLPHPGCVATFHGVTPWLALNFSNRAIVVYRSGPANGTGG
jgi:hypothetical protein